MSYASIMALAQLSVPEQDIEALLTEPDRLKEYTRELIAKYVTSPDNKLDGTLHPGMNVVNHALHYDAGTNVFTEDAMQKTGDAEIKAEEERFIAAMKDYEKEVKDKYKTGVNVSQLHTMEQVWEVVDDAIERYQKEDVKGFWGRIRAAFRKFGEHNKALEGWLGLVPSESHYLSSVCGGLKLILKVWPLPDYLRRKCISKTFKALVQQSSFEFSLNEKLQNMEKSRDAFNDEANICNQEMLKKVRDVSQSTQQSTQDALKEIDTIKNLLELGVQEQLRVQFFIRAGIQMQDEKFNAIMRRQSDLDRKMTGLHETLNVLNAALSMFHANPQSEDQAYMNTRQLDAPITNRALLAHGFINFNQVSSKSVSKKELSHGDLRNVILSRLDYDSDAPAADAFANYTLGATLPREEQDRCMHVIHSAALTYWIKTTESTPLLINGNSTEARRQSPLSFICAKLVHTFDQIRSQGTKKTRDLLISVYYFCGLHLDYNDTRKAGKDSPVGIVNSILAQLLMCCSKRVNLLPIIKLGDFDDSKMRDVCKRFEAVLDQLPQEIVVFCIIDGLSIYMDADDEKMNKDARKLFQWLTTLARRGSEEQRGCIFKVLITAPIRLHGGVEDLLEESETLNVPRRVQSVGGFTETKWEVGVRRTIEELE